MVRLYLRLAICIKNSISGVKKSYESYNSACKARVIQNLDSKR